MEVASRLRNLSLEQYQAAFRENAIDLGVLPDQTDQDLEKLGVVLGHAQIRADSDRVDAYPACRK